MPLAEPAVSVIIPIYKVERHLPQCVESILAQTYQALEIVLVDDGSPDECPRIADEFAARDPRITVIHQTNQGLSAARNAGLSRARGDYVTFVDSDDYWEGSDSLELCMLAIRRRPETDVLFFTGSWFDESTRRRAARGRVWDRARMSGVSNVDAWSYLVEISDVNPSACTKIVRRRFLLDNHLSFRRDIFSEDVEWFLRLITCTATYDYLPLPIYVYRKNRAGSITNTIGRENVQDLLATVVRSAKGVQAMGASADFERDYLSYCFYQFTIALGFYGGLSRQDRATLHSTVEQARFLTAYDDYGRSTLVARLIRLTGVHATAYVLNAFLRLRALRSRSPR